MDKSKSTLIVSEMLNDQLLSGVKERFDLLEELSAKYKEKAYTHKEDEDIMIYTILLIVEGIILRSKLELGE